MIVGITGYLASGKSTVSELLKKKGFIVYSCSDLIREECKNRGLEITRDNLRTVGNELRKSQGSNVLAKWLKEKIILQGLDKNYVVESIRTAGEIEELRKLPHFYLVFVDVDAKVRYNRAKERLKEEEHIASFEEFMTSERKEMNGKDKQLQNLLECKELSEFTINNNGALEDLEKEVDGLLLRIQLRDKEKPEFHRYFLSIAEVVSRRSNCLSTRFGAVIVKNSTIISTGYVGAPRGTRDCYDRRYCIRRKNNVPSGQQYELCASVHAEQNAIINAARQGVSTLGTTMYIFGEKVHLATHELIDCYPCFICKKMIINAGITEVVCSRADGSYRLYRVDDWVKEWKEKEITEDNEKYRIDYGDKNGQN